ncbi:MAG TPA: ATP synthase F0 subunit C [Patescibacteria group bacterium]|nr:ATP synthase F0 subunit C [Patescibacteria group bacterium]
MLHVLAEAAASPLASPTFVKGMTIAIGTIMPAFSLGLIGKSVMNAVGRNPEVAGRILPIMLISSALVEAIAIYVLVVVFTI